MEWVPVIIMCLLLVGYWIGMRLVELYNDEINGKNLGDIINEYNKAIKNGQKQNKEECS